MSSHLTLRKKLQALYEVVLFRPLTAAAVIVFSFFAAMLEAIGLSFLLPIIELAREGETDGSTSGALEAFTTVYETLNIPFTLEFVIVGVAVVMTVRYTSSFLVSWARVSLREQYVQFLQTESFEHALDAEISYFDKQGSDDILNAIVTQANRAGQVINHMIRIIEQGLLTLMYLSISLYLAPILTIAAGVLLAGISFLLRNVLESGYSVGDRVAEANEGIQETAQAGMQGIRDVKLFRMVDELREDFSESLSQAVHSTVTLSRNQAALDNFYQLITAVTIFVLIYAAVRISELSFAGLGLFLFTMFRLAPRVSSLNNLVYQLEGTLPHLVRTQQFIDELAERSEPKSGSEAVPDPVGTVTFDDISFTYDTGEQIFDGISLSFDTNEFIGFVGPSGAGKSTIVSLLTRLYEPDDGEIRANDVPIDQFDLDEWRSRVSVVRQQPFIFNESLRRNVTIGNRDATDAEVQRVCEIAQVTEFLSDLPSGYETVLGDDGVRLSGGQKQRIALARALLKDADLLILDEATSDLDSNIEEDVHQAIEAMDRDYAMLVIAHRLSTVVNADRIYTIEDGRITESGRHGELLEKRGTYADLYDAQHR
jgi:subfamily B ATP-binding cassette protein MsbA